jgi:hypothetical protein
MGGKRALDKEYSVYMYILMFLFKLVEASLCIYIYIYTHNVPCHNAIIIQSMEKR